MFYQDFIKKRNGQQLKHIQIKKTMKIHKSTDTNYKYYKITNLQYYNLQIQTMKQQNYNSTN